MGDTLSKPVTDKYSHQLENKRFRVGASGMQGYVTQCKYTTYKMWGKKTSTISPAQVLRNPNNFCQRLIA